jgi:hypothetical protein
MTTRNKKTATTTSLKPATPAGKKDQATLLNAWMKKEKGSPSKGPNPVTPASPNPEVVTVPMMENTPSAMDDTDTAMGMGHTPRSPPVMTPCDSSLSKRLKDARNTPPALPSQPSPSDPKPITTHPKPPPAQQQEFQTEEGLMKENPSKQISDSTDGARDQLEPSPTSPPSLSKARGRSKLRAPSSVGIHKDASTSARAQTPPRSNRTEPTNTRFEFRITIPATSPDDALKAVRDTLAKVLSKIWDSDKKAKVVPWYKDSKSALLSSIDDIPTTLLALHQYFPRLTPHSKGGTKFTSIRLRLSIPPSTLKDDIDWYLRDNKHGLYLAQIQAETVDTILWLLWSHDMIDVSILRTILEERVEAATNQKIPIGLRWRIIQLDQPGRIAEEDAVKALHIDVAREHRVPAKMALEHIYSSKQKGWPLHIRMHAVLLLKDAMNSQDKKDIHRLIGRQASFNDEDLGKRKINCWEIKELDFESKEGYSLRDYIMAILHPENDERSLFHSVDHLRFNWSTVMFTCMPLVEAEARNMVSCLITYLNHLHGDVINEFFTKEAQLRADGSYWDDVDQCIQNEDNEHVSSSLLDDMDDDYILPPVNKKGKTSDTLAPARPEPVNASLQTPLQRNTFREDEDSIGTFRQAQASELVSLSSSIQSESAMSVESLVSIISALESLLSTHKIALPSNILTSTLSEDQSKDRESRHN